MEGIFQLKNDKIIFVNQNGADFLKKELTTLFGSSFYDYLDGVHQLYFENILNRFQTKELEDYLAEFELIDSFGAKNYYTIKFHAIANQNQGINVLCTVKPNENSKQEVEAQIKLQRRYDALLYNTVDGIFIFDYLKDEIVDANRAAQEILKYDSREEMIGLSQFDLLPRTNPLYPGVDMIEVTRQNGEDVKKGKAFFAGGLFLCKDKSHVLIRAKIIPTFNKFGEAFIMFQDVTKIIYAKKALKESEKKYR